MECSTEDHQSFVVLNKLDFMNWKKKRCPVCRRMISVIVVRSGKYVTDLEIYEHQN